MLNEEKYTIKRVREIFEGAPADVEENLDILVALDQLPKADRSALVALAQGHSLKEALHIAGITGNAIREQARLLRALIEALNGEVGK